MMFIVFQVDDSTIVDCFTGVARSDVILIFFHTIWGHGRRTGIDRSDSRKAPQKVNQDESSCTEHVGWPRCMADSLNHMMLLYVLLPKTPKHQTFEESWDGILASSFTTLLICMPILDHWCIFLVASPAISEISQISIPI